MSWVDDDTACVAAKKTDGITACDYTMQGSWQNDANSAIPCRTRSGCRDFLLRNLVYDGVIEVDAVTQPLWLLSVVFLAKTFLSPVNPWMIFLKKNNTDVQAKARTNLRGDS